MMTSGEHKHNFKTWVLQKLFNTVAQKKNTHSLALWRGRGSQPPWYSSLYTEKSEKHVWAFLWAMVNSRYRCLCHRWIWEQHTPLQTGLSNHTPSTSGVYVGDPRQLKWTPVKLSSGDRSPLQRTLEALPVAYLALYPNSHTSPSLIYLAWQSQKLHNSKISKYRGKWQPTLA